MKYLLYGGPDHGSIVHRNLPSKHCSTRCVILGQFRVVIHKSEPKDFELSKKFKRFMTECERLLSDPAMFKGPSPKSSKRPLQKHEPEHLELHGHDYVRNCFRQTKTP